MRKMAGSEPTQKNDDSFGTFDAKNRLSELLDRVERGESIVITRHGEPVARLVPFEQRIDAPVVERAIQGLRKLRKKAKLGGVSLRDLIDEGRK